MKLVTTSAVLLASLGGLAVSSAEEAKQSMKCETGPVSKMYGSAPWLVYSCDDSKSVVFMSAPNSPAMPFYFLLHPNGEHYQLEGEGTGNKNVTAAAAEELQHLSKADISALINETHTIHNVPAR